MSDHPGAYLPADEPVRINLGRPSRRLQVANVGDRAIQVGSHFHFFEVNRRLQFDRTAAYGMRLNIPAGTAVRFEPGDRREVALVPMGGTRTVMGCNGLIDGPLDAPGSEDRALSRAARMGFITTADGDPGAWK